MITTKMVNEWVDLYVNQKKNCNQISRLYGVSRDTVRLNLNARGILTPNPRIHTCYNEFHKNKYIICVYDLNETLVWQFNTAREMAETLNKPYDSIKSHLTEKRLRMKFRHKANWYRIYLVEVDE